MRTFIENPLNHSIFSVGVSQIINWGVLYYSLALIGPKIIAELQWPEVFVYAGFSISALISGLLSPISGRAIDRMGGRNIMAIGSLIGAIGVLFLSSISSMYEYVFAWVVIGISMSMCLYDSAFATLAKIAGKSTRTSISGITLLAGFSSTLTWPATAYLLSLYDWRLVLIIYSIIMACLCAPILFLGLKDYSNRKMFVQIGASPRSETDLDKSEFVIPSKSIAEVMLLLGAIMAAQGFVANAISVHVISLFETIGIGTFGAILAGSLIGPSQVGARLIEFLFGERLNPINLGLITVVLLPISLFVPLLLPNFITTGIIFGISYGVSNGLFTIVRGILPHALFGPIGYGQRLGTLAAPTLIFKASAPAVFGYLLSTAGPTLSLFALFIISVLACLAMIKLAKLVRKIHPVQ